MKSFQIRSKTIALTTLLVLKFMFLVDPSEATGNADNCVSKSLTQRLSGWLTLSQKTQTDRGTIQARNGILSQASLRSIQRDLRLTSPPDPRSIEILDFQSRISTIGTTRYGRTDNVVLWDYGFGDVRIERNGVLENELVQNAGVFEKPREPVKFRAYDADGTKHESGILIEGNTEEDVSEAFLIRHFNEFMKEAFKRSKTGKIQAFEINHVHPHQEVRIGSQYTAHQLSPTDIETAQYISTGLNDVPVIVRATVPNGYTYSAVFAGHMNITEEVAR